MLIGLNGFKGTGKDTVGKYLVENYGFTRISFAEKLKASAAACFGIDPAKWEDWKNDDSMEVMIQRNLSSEIGRARLVGQEPPVSLPHVRVTVREFLQKYGTEAHRDVFGYNFWVDAALKGVEPLMYDYVVTDARFPNEFDAIHRLGGVTVQIIRPGHEGEGHASEQAPDPSKIDYKMFNDSDLSALYEEVDNLYAFLNA